MLKFLLALSLFACVAAGPAATNPAGDLREYPNFGVAFRGPVGWREVMPNMVKRIGVWTSADAGVGTEPSTMIMVEGGRPNDPDLETGAASLARNWGGKVAAEKTSLDGSPALRILVDKRTARLMPVEGIVTFHDSHFYMIMGGVVEGHSCHNEIEAIRSSWKWIPTSGYASHLKFRPAPLFLDSGKVSISVPELMHTYATATPDRVLDLGIYDITTNNPSFLVYVQLAPRVKGEDFEGLKKRFLLGINSKMKWAEPLTWHDVKGPTPRVATKAIVMQNPAAPKQAPVPVGWGLVELDADHVLLINFTIEPKPAADFLAYQDIAESMVQSVIIKSGAAGK